MQLAALRNLWKISRPRFYSYLFGPFLVGAAAGADSLQDFTDPWFWILLSFFLVPANLFLYGINDLFDEETDTFNAKKQSKEHLLQQKERQTLEVFLLAIVLLTAWLGFQMILLPLSLLCVFMILAASYSAPPIRFKARPFFDCYSNILYAVPGFLGYALFSNQLPSLPVIILAWAWTAGMHTYSAVPDIAADMKAGIQTTATKLGAERALMFVLIHWTIFALLVSWLLPLPWGLLAWVYPALAIYTRRNLPKIDQLYWLFPAITTTIGFLAFWYFIIMRFYV